MSNDSEIVLMGIVLSDSAIREWGTGKVSYIGTFHQYHCPGFPFGVPSFVITPLLTNIHGKMDKPLAVTVRIEDPKTRLIIANTLGNVAVPPDYVWTGSEVLDAPFPIPPLVFQSAGIYVISIMVNGDQVGTRSLPVNSITVPPQTHKP